MSLSWREHHEAHRELRVATIRYENIGDALGDRFLEAIEAAIESVLDPAFRWGYYRDRVSDPQVYSRRVSGFPFNIIYVLLDEEVVVIAYAHERRQPEYWKGRLEDSFGRSGTSAQ